MAVTVPHRVRKCCSGRLHEILVDSLADFQAPTGKMHVSLTNFDCKPEGGGIYMMRRHQDETTRNKNQAVVMVGYRNASVLVSQRGQVNKSRSKTSNLGFVRLVELVEGKIASVSSTAHLASAIARAGVFLERQCLVTLTSGSKDSREQEIDSLIDAINSARVEYSAALCSWLKEVLPQQLMLDEVILCGGTADFMRLELENHFGGLNVVWNAGIQLPAHLDSPELGVRLCDAYGMYYYFRSVVKTATVSP